MDSTEINEVDTSSHVLQSRLGNEQLISFEDLSEQLKTNTADEHYTTLSAPTVPPPPPPPTTIIRRTVIEASHWESNNPVVDSVASQAKTELKKGQQQAEDIFTKGKRIVKQNWDQAFTSLGQAQKKISQMVPKQAHALIYWKNPIQSGIVFGLSLSVIITFMFLSSLAAISFWLLAFLIAVGLTKLYNYVMTTFVGRVQNDIFEAIFPPDVTITEQQAQALANAIRANGTSLLKTARSLFLWKDLTNSTLFGLILFVFFYIGLSMNALTFTLIGLLFLFTVPKIYQVYQVPIDRTAQRVLDQINQLLAKVTSKLPNKPKTT